jgi:single-stranded DNA-binding protein
MNYVKRGSQIMIEGKLTVRPWQDAATGKERFSLDIRASDFVLLGGNQDGRPQLPPLGAPPTAYNANAGTAPGTYSTAPPKQQNNQQDPLAGNSQYATGGANQADQDDLPF